MPVRRIDDVLGPLGEAFARFWAAYPPRQPNPRAAAAREFARLCRFDRAEAERLVAAAAAYAAECRRLAIRPEYIPHARTWLAQARHLDYPPYAPVPAAAPAGGLVVPEEVRRHPWWAAAGRAGVEPHAFKTWLMPLRLSQLIERERARLIAPSRLVADRVRAEFLPVLRRALGVTEVEIEP